MYLNILTQILNEKFHCHEYIRILNIDEQINNSTEQHGK